MKACRYDAPRPDPDALAALIKGSTVGPSGQCLVATYGDLQCPAPGWTTSRCSSGWSSVMITNRSCLGDLAIYWPPSYAAWAPARVHVRLQHRRFQERS